MPGMCGHQCHTKVGQVTFELWLTFPEDGEDLASSIPRQVLGLEGRNEDIITLTTASVRV